MKATILVIDDHPLVRSVVKALLETRGYHVLVAEDGPIALELFKRHPVTAALVDVDMPGPDGVEVCRTLRETIQEDGEPIPVWLMTGVTRPELPERAEAAGALGILAKPFTTAQLVSCIEQMVEIVRARRSAA